MTSRTRHHQQPGEPRPDPWLEQLIREAVASQHVPLDRQQRHLARIKRQGQSQAAMNPWSTSDPGQRTLFTGDNDAPRLPAIGQREPSAMLPPIRTRRRQVTELTFGFLGFVVVAALLVALFRQEPEENLGATDLTSTATATATVAATTQPTSTAASATTTLPAIDAPANTPLIETGPPDTPTPNDTPAPAPTPTSTSTVPLTNEQTLNGYGVLTRWDAKVYNLGALTVGPDDRVYALDRDSGQVSVYTVEDTLVDRINLTADYGVVPLIGDHHDLAVDGDGTIYLLESFVNGGAFSYVDIYRFAADGSAIGGSLWLANSEPLVNALAIAVADDGLLYVAENLPDGTGRIRTFNTDGLETARWEDAGDAPIPSGIQSIEVTDDAVYILVDSHDSPGSILKFNLDGTFAGTLVRFADNHDETERPVKQSLAVDPAGNLFVVDPADGSVTGYRATEEWSGMLLHWSPDDTDESEREPNVQVAVDSRGYIYILQSERVLMTVLAPAEVVEAARQPSFNVLPSNGTCATGFTAHGAGYLAGDQITILASVAGSDEFVEVGQTTVILEEGYSYPQIDATVSLEPLGICDDEIDLEGIEITFIARATNDPKEPNPSTITLFSSSNVPTLAMTPLRGDCDTIITATGKNFVPGTTITLMLGGHSPLPLAHRVPVNDDGVFEVELAASELPECVRSPEAPLTISQPIFASTEWGNKGDPYPFAKATFTVSATD